MTEKFIIYPKDKKLFGVKYDKKVDKVTIGGPIKSHPWMVMIISEIFEKDVPPASFTAKNKIRYELECSEEDFETRMNDLSKLGSFGIVKVRTFGRLMR